MEGSAVGINIPGRSVFREVLGSNLGRDTGSCDVSETQQVSR